jgi:hypothetical protein
VNETPADWGWVMPALIGAAVGASVGYAVRGMQSRDREARAAAAEVEGYRRGLQDGHNRLAARQARKARMGRLTAPRRDTIPEGV